MGLKIHKGGMRSERGLSLIEMAIAIVVIGFILLAGFVFLNLYNDMKVKTHTQASMDSIEEALERYRSLNGKYPCPASLTAVPNSAEYGRASDANCASGSPLAGQTFRATGRGGQKIRYGAIPFKDLNIAEEASYDGNKRRIIYGITEYYASGTPDFSKDNGAILIVDSANQNATAVAGNVVYAYFSAGKDPRGAYNYDGKIVRACDSSADAGENCDFDDRLRANLYKQDEGSNPFTYMFRYSASTVAFEWRTGTWGTCTCSNPVTSVSRSVQCYNKATGAVAANANLCAGLAKPAASQSCTVFCWKVGSWSSCSCSGRKTRSVTCKDNFSQSASDGFCPSPKPPTSASCTPPDSCNPPPEPPTTGTCTPGTVTAACVGPCGGAGTQTVTTTTCNGTTPTTTTKSVACTVPNTGSWVFSHNSGGCVAGKCGGPGKILVVEKNTCTGATRQGPDANCSVPIDTTTPGCCADTSWTAGAATPATCPSSCKKTITETSNCGNTRNVTITCSGGSCCPSGCFYEHGMCQCGGGSSSGGSGGANDSDGDGSTDSHG